MIKIDDSIRLLVVNLEKMCQTYKIDNLRIICHQTDEQFLRVEGQDGIYKITAPKGYLFFRGLVLLAREVRVNQTSIKLEEKVRYSQFSFMADASRNAVLTVTSCQRLMPILASMGYSTFQLYMEDTYEIEGQPYFGYFRGAYSIEELCQIEQIAEDYGMTFSPCIQTLAHLSAYVKWNSRDIQAIRDVEDILLIGSDGTYELIDKMFQSMSHLKTRRINIGMDEAHLVGLGQYLDQHGYQNRSLLMCQHLDRVLKIAEKYGFHCSMWSDMFFQLLATSKNYDSDLAMTSEVREYLDRLKKRVTLIYWDYYQTDEASYCQKLERHRQLGDNIAFAGGAWKWIGYTPDNQFSMEIAPKAHAACQAYNISDVTITAWGDNGGEASVFSILPSLQAWAELHYTDTLDNLAPNFELVCQMPLEDFLSIDLANLIPSNPHTVSGFNPNRYILYQDILCPLLDQHIDHNQDALCYQKAKEKLDKVLDCAGDWAYLFKTQSSLCHLLSLKADIGYLIRQHYQNDDKEGLAIDLVNLEELALALADFRKIYSQQWLFDHKIFGLDTIDIRLGGLQARIDRARERLASYMRADIEHLEELEVAILPYNDIYQKERYLATSANQWHFLVTASTLCTT